MNRGISRESSYTRMINENGDLQQPNKLHCKQSKQENMGLNQQNGTEPTTIQHCNMCRSPTKKQKKTCFNKSDTLTEPQIEHIQLQNDQEPRMKTVCWLTWYSLSQSYQAWHLFSYMPNNGTNTNDRLIGYISRFLMFGHIVQRLGPLTCQVFFLTHKTTLTAHALLPVSPFALYVLSWFQA
jgi:hypothetical protein